MAEIYFIYCQAGVVIKIYIKKWFYPGGVAKAVTVATRNINRGHSSRERETKPAWILLIHVVVSYIAAIKRRWCFCSGRTGMATAAVQR